MSAYQLLIHQSEVIGEEEQVEILTKTCSPQVQLYWTKRKQYILHGTDTEAQLVLFECSKRSSFSKKI